MARGLTQAVRKLAKNGNSVNIFKEMTMGQKISAASSAIAGVSSYNASRAEGASVPGAMAQATVDAFLVDIIGLPLYLTGAAAMNLPSLAVRGYEHLSLKAREMSTAGHAKPFQGNAFVDNEQIYTMRQAGMAMMDQSKQSLRQTILGNEAQALHR